MTGIIFMTHFPDGKFCDIFAKGLCGLTVYFGIGRLIILCYLSYSATILVTQNTLKFNVTGQYFVANAAAKLLPMPLFASVMSYVTNNQSRNPNNSKVCLELNVKYAIGSFTSLKLIVFGHRLVKS